MGAAPVAASTPTYVCEYSASNHHVAVTLTGDANAEIQRQTNGHINLNGAWCGNQATVTNTDQVIVTGDAGNQIFFIDLLNKGFAPGFTNEPGKSDEIEFVINLGTGSQDGVDVLGTDAANKVDLGSDTSIFGVVEKINLNAGETTGIDADVVMVNVEAMTVDAAGGNDRIRGEGKAGTGPDAFALPLWVYGGDGNDVIRGGSEDDHLYGAKGIDKVWGNAGDDEIYLDDYAAGDFGYGGPGDDICHLDWTGDVCEV